VRSINCGNVPPVRSVERHNRETVTQNHGLLH
jgi:hypothetical protein